MTTRPRPDRQMVRRPPRAGAHVHAGRFDLEVAVDDDPVELRHRMARVEARAGRARCGTRAARSLRQPADRAPFVGVAHQHRRHLVRPPPDRVEDRPQLPLPPQAGQVEVHADDPQRLLVDQQLGDHRAARLQRRQVERRAVEHADMLLHQDRIAVPADVARIDLEQPVGVLAHLVERALVADARGAPACTGRGCRSAHAAPSTRARRCACRPPAARRCRHRSPAARAGCDAGRAGRRARRPCACCSSRA